MSNPAMQLIEIHRDLNADLAGLKFAPPVHTVYNPLEYAFPVFKEYLERFAAVGIRAMLMGMNPGPWGMAQTGIPFGSVPRVRDWMGLGDLGEGAIGKPGREHPKRPIQGFSCPRVEVSGDRLWGLMEQRYPDPADFFARHMVINYCPLVFMEDSGRNRTPDKLPAAEQAPLTEACDRALARQIEVIRPRLLIGVGKFAEKRLKDVASQNGFDLPVGSILHPSPASPAANRDWAGSATRQLADLGVWG
jgi:single-strand selective monofunctional uracil DNA glycosylase